MKFKSYCEQYSLTIHDYKRILIISDYKEYFPRTGQHRHMELADLVLVWRNGNWAKIKDRWGNDGGCFEMTPVEELKMLLVATIM
jgi:hypothetical protein